MELKIVCKRLMTKDLSAALTRGESAADTVGITMPRYYGEHDLSQFSFRMTASAKGSDGAAEQLLTRDSLTEDTLRLLWTVTSDFTCLGEELNLILAGTGPGGEVIKFSSEPVAIGADGEMEFLPTPAVSEQLWSQVQQEAQKAVSAAERAEAAAEVYSISPATETEVGGVLSGGDISVSGTGEVTVRSVGGVTIPADAEFTDTVYELPKASETVLGGVKVDGRTVTINEDGVISAAEQYVLPAASDGALGGVKSGGDISVSEDGRVTVRAIGGAAVPEDAKFTDTVYMLPPATAGSLGGVMVDGTTITTDGRGVISVVGGTGADGEIILPKATENVLGAVRVDGTTITANADGVISAGVPEDYELPAASAEELGGVKSGGDITVSENGSVTVNSVGGRTVLSDVPADAVFTDTEYTLPAASAEELGGVKSGGDIAVSESGIVTVGSVGGRTVLTDVPADAVFTDTVYTLPAASAEELGGVKSGGDIAVSESGIVTVGSVGGRTVLTDVPADAVFTDTVYTLPAATADTLGGVKPDGSTINVDSNGVISTASTVPTAKITKLLQTTKTANKSSSYDITVTLNATIANYKYLLIKLRLIQNAEFFNPQLYLLPVSDIIYSRKYHFFKKFSTSATADDDVIVTLTFNSGTSLSVSGISDLIVVWGLNDLFQEVSL